MSLKLRRVAFGSGCEVTAEPPEVPARGSTWQYMASSLFSLLSLHYQNISGCIKSCGPKVDADAPEATVAGLR